LCLSGVLLLVLCDRYEMPGDRYVIVV
jgi:hypothetical protein